jgi:4-amino-4-deoxy-L-arabinose transferase-like glycosyltransferase
MLKKFIFLLLLLVITVVPRFIFLDRVPAAINNDEFHYVLNAKSFFVTGKDITGKINPLDILLFKYPQDESVQAELPYFLEMPVFGFFNLSLAGSALPNALLGVLTVALIYLITRKLFDENTALMAGFMAAINPWLIYVSRSSYEAGTVIPFFLAIIYLLLITKGWKILLTIPVSFLAFYSYIGTKLIFLPFMLLAILYVYFYVNKRKYLKQYILLFASSLLITLFFLFQLKQIPGARISEILTPNNIAITKQVNYMRATTIQNPLMTFSENKYYIYLTVLAKNTFNTFSPYNLFAGGDYFYLIGIHGLFYYIDAFFLALGLLFLFFKNRKLFVFLIIGTFLAALPEVFHNAAGSGILMSHVTLIVPFLIVIIGFGISNFLKLRNSKYFYVFLGVIILVYGFLFLSFVNSYFFRFPLQEGTFEMQDRTLAKYISLADNTKDPITIYSSYPELAFKEFLFYSNSYKKSNIESLNKSLTERNFVINNISFLSCGKQPLIRGKNLFINDLNCGKRLDGALTIGQLSDSGARYYIYNDKICSKYALAGFISNLKLSDFSIEGLPVKNFCQTFIISN